MSITDLSSLAGGMVAKGARISFYRASIGSQVAGHEASLWRGSGFPAQGAIPTTAERCNDQMVGAIPLISRGASEDRVISQVQHSMGASGHLLLIEDRLMHMGGLSGIVTTEQVVGVDLYANLANDNLSARIGASDFSEVEWYLEWYTATGSTAATPTASVTFNDGTTGTVNAWVLGATALPTSVAASRRYKLVPTNGKYIRSVESVTLSGTTGTAGNFGVTAVKRIAESACSGSNQTEVRDWSVIGLPKVEDNACLTLSMIPNGTSTGVLAGSLRQAAA